MSCRKLAGCLEGGTLLHCTLVMSYQGMIEVFRGSFRQVLDCLLAPCRWKARLRRRCQTTRKLFPQWSRPVAFVEEGENRGCEGKAGVATPLEADGSAEAHGLSIFFSRSRSARKGAPVKAANTDGLQSRHFHGYAMRPRKIEVVRHVLPIAELYANSAHRKVWDARLANEELRAVFPV